MFIILFVINIVLHAADYMLTVFGIKSGATEANPIWRHLFSRMNPTGVFSAMFGWKMLFILLLWLSQSVAVNLICAVIFAAVVAWNAAVILRMAK